MNIKNFESCLWIMILPFLLLGCHSPDATPVAPKIGPWLIHLDIGEHDLPIEVSHTIKGEKNVWAFHNAKEIIEVDEVSQVGDSLFIRMPVFDSEFRGKIVADSVIRGHWHNYSRGDYKIPFEATHGEWICESGDAVDFNGRWAVNFGKDSMELTPAVGIFSQDNNEVTGTFLTETGDYRYLQGCVVGGEMTLSTFDGAHAFLFTLKMAGDKSLSGTFFSGKHWNELFTAVRDDSATLRDPETLTYLNPGYDKFSFSFPALDSQLVSLEDAQFQGKVVLVQIMGSWCPNCLDESKLYAQWYDKYHDQGLEIIGLAFERTPTFAKAASNIRRLQKRLGTPYPILIASTSNNKQEAAKKLPMLNHVMSYPTSIFIDRSGDVQKIHTGFYGPGTGAYYTEFVEEMEALLEELIAE